MALSAMIVECEQFIYLLLFQPRFTKMSKCTCFVFSFFLLDIQRQCQLTSLTYIYPSLNTLTDPFLVFILPFHALHSDFPPSISVNCFLSIFLHCFVCFLSLTCHHPTLCIYSPPYLILAYCFVLFFSFFFWLFPNFFDCFIKDTFGICGGYG